IADVAAHVRPGSPLAQAAWMRAFTVYGPGWTDPMLPKLLEENLSLEHNQERLGLTVSITLDKHFRPTHTSFMPVITHPDNSSYAQAHARMQADPQFQLMADIAQGVQHAYFRGQSIPWEEIFGQRTLRRVKGADQMQAMEMVATYMLLANNSVAEFFRQSGLPFLYRNFDEADAHATYSTTPVRHSALERMGLKGSYCHFTSPIRRAPDYFNGLMVHHAVRVLDDVEAKLGTCLPGVQPAALRQAVWAQGAEYLSLLHAQPGVNRAHARRQLQKLLVQTCETLLPAGARVPAARLRQLAGQIQVPELPYTREELEGFAAHMNALAHSPEIRQIEKQNEKYDSSVERLEVVAEKTREDLSGLSREKFSSLLQAAALTGDMPRSLFDEAIARVKANNFDRTQDAFAIFVRAQHPGVHRWTALKREVARSIKHDPAIVNALMEKLEQHVLPATLGEHTTLLPSEEKAPEGAEPSRVCATLLVMRDAQGRAFAAPFYSVGHNQRAALSHARYSFLEHYAFGQLQPLERTAVPNLLYAELDMEGAKKRELLERMVEGAGASVHWHAQPLADGALMQIEVRGGDMRAPIRVEAQEDTPERAEHVAIRRILRNDAFKTVVSRNQNVARDVLNPQTVLEEMVAARGGSIAFERLTNGRQQGPHQVRASMEWQGQKKIFTGAGPNIDRAMRAASVKALEYFDWKLPDNRPAKSWVTDMQTRERGEDKGFFAGK
ncbi:MAG: hypothetical protein DI582_08805, partial [Azospirillum brasilense]